MYLAEDDIRLCLQVGKHNPQYVDLLTKLRAAELESLTRCSLDTFCTQKGRVQMLTEILQHLRP